MKIKTVPIEKIDVMTLSREELVLLKKFKFSKEFEILNKIASGAKTRRAFEALDANDISAIAMLKGINIGLDFILDAVERAEKELKARGDKSGVDNDE